MLTYSASCISQLWKEIWLNDLKNMLNCYCKIKKIWAHLFIFFSSDSFPIWYMQKFQIILCFWYCGRVEHCRNVLIQLESDCRVKVNFLWIKNMASISHKNDYTEFKWTPNGTISYWCIPKWEPNQKSDLQMSYCNISSSSPNNIINQHQNEHVNTLFSKWDIHHRQI